MPESYIKSAETQRACCYNCVVPYLCPEMSETQKEALAYAVKQPLVYVNVQLRNWMAFTKLGVSGIYAPSDFSTTMLDFPVSMGSYKFPSSPQEPCVLHMLRTPCKPGLTAKEQFKAGRYELPPLLIRRSNARFMIN